MATLDNINLFANGGPTSNSIEDEYQKLVAVINSPGVMGTPPTFEEFVAMRQKQQAADKARQTMTQELGAGNVKKAYEEGFTQLPILEQLGTYVFPPTGVPIESYETGYFADQAGFGMKSPQEFVLDVLNPTKNIFQKTPIKAEDPMSAVLAPLSALGALGGIGELANIPKAGLMALRRYQQKTMDGGGGGIGGLPPDAFEADVNRFALDPSSGIKSPTIESLIRNAPKNLKGKQITDWLNSKGAPSKGVKPKELPFLKIDRFIEENPNATISDVVEHAGDSKITIDVNSYRDIGEPGSDFYFETTTPEFDPLDSSYKNNAYMVELVRDDKDFYKNDLLEAFLNIKADKLGMDEGILPSLIKREYDDITDAELKALGIDEEDLIEKVGDELYKDNPYELIEPKGAGLVGGTSGTFAFGNYDTGYQLFINNNRIDMKDYGYDDIPYSKNEAEIRLQSIMEQEELIDIGMYGERQRFKTYVDGTLPGGKNYEEKVYTYENADESIDGLSHFDDGNQIAHMLGRDRVLEDGTVSKHADEIQSDLHKKGLKYGYKNPVKDAIELEKIAEETVSFNTMVDKLTERTRGEVERFKQQYPGVLESPDSAMQYPIKRINSSFDEIKSIDADSSYGNQRQRNSANLTKIETILATLEAQEIMALERRGIIVNRNEGLHRVGIGPGTDGEKIFLDFHVKTKDGAYADYFKASDQNISILQKSNAIDRKAPDYPFKGDDYAEMVVKNMIMDAIREGKAAVSVSASPAVVARYSQQEAEFFPRFYDKTIPNMMEKLAKKYGGDFERGSLDLEDIHGEKIKQLRENPTNELEMEISNEMGLRGSKLSWNAILDEYNKSAKANIIRITPEMRDKILKEGLPQMYMGGKVTKSNSMDRPIEGNRREM